MENKAIAVVENKPKGKSRRNLILVIIIIAAVVAVGIFGYTRLNSMSGQTVVSIPETVTLAKTDLESKVTGSGNFVSADPVTVGSNVQYGEVKSVYVEAGDMVYEGDVLAVLETSDIERNISDTSGTIKDAQESDARNRSQAQRDFDNANSQYYSYHDNYYKPLKDAYTAFQTANTAYTDAQKASDANPSDTALKTDLANKESAKTAAWQAYTTLSEQKKTTLEQAEEQLQQLDSAWYTAKDHLDAAQGQDSAKMDRSTLESLNEDLSNASIVSPITGIVTKVNTEDGKAAAGDMFTVENTGSLQVSTSVAEYDVIKIETGMKAYITSNATDEQEYEGVVDYVASVATDTGGNFEVIVNVTSEIGQLKPGMTATVSIVTASKSDVFAVPIDAVVTRADGQKVVYVYESKDGTTPFEDGSGDMPARGTPPMDTDGGSFAISGVPGSVSGTGGVDMSDLSQREIEVETGMETDYYIEISSDELSEGMMIVADPEGRNVQTDSGMNQFMMGGPGMGGAEVSAAGGAEPRDGGDGGAVVVSGAPQ